MPKTPIPKKNKRIEAVIGEDLFNQMVFFMQKMSMTQGEFVRQAISFYINHLVESEKKKKEVISS